MHTYKQYFNYNISILAINIKNATFLLLFVKKTSFIKVTYIIEELNGALYGMLSIG
jgi:hypothetical protein